MSEITSKATNRAGLMLFIVVLVTIILDQANKAWLLYSFGMEGRPPVYVNEFFSLVMVWNKGVSFGMLNHGAEMMPYVLIAVAVVISGLMTRLALQSPSCWERLGYGMVIGGALSNAIDRIRVGAVADFFYFHVGEHGWPAFNIADAMICMGVGLLLIRLLKTPTRT